MMLTERIELIRYVKEGGKSIRSIYECLLALIGFIRGEGERNWIVRNEKGDDEPESRPDRHFGKVELDDAVSLAIKFYLAST